MLNRFKRALAEWRRPGHAPQREENASAEAGFETVPRTPPSYFASTYATPVVPEDRVRDILATVAPLTMVHPTGVEFVIHETVRLIQAGVRGNIVECGVWKGGSALASLLAQRAVFGKVQRPVYLLDSFEGLPAVTDKDGPWAREWQTGPDAERFMSNCRAGVADLQRELVEHGFGAQEAIVVKGWFKDTLPRVVQDCAGPGIALLRLDGDWYDSTTECLDALEPHVVTEGTIIVDDYYAWDGCARAVHDYLSRNDLPYRLKSCYGNYGMYFVKRPYRQNYDVF